MKLTIQHVSNGFILEDDEYTQVFRYEGDDTLEDTESLQEMTVSILESLGVYYSKHKKYNVIIEIKENNL